MMSKVILWYTYFHQLEHIIVGSLEQAFESAYWMQESLSGAPLLFETEKKKYHHDCKQYSLWEKNYEKERAKPRVWADEPTHEIWIKTPDEIRNIWPEIAWVKHPEYYTSFDSANKAYEDFVSFLGADRVELKEIS